MACQVIHPAGGTLAMAMRSHLLSPIDEFEVLTESRKPTPFLRLHATSNFPLSQPDALRSLIILNLHRIPFPSHPVCGA